MAMAVLLDTVVCVCFMKREVAAGVGVCILYAACAYGGMLAYPVCTTCCMLHVRMPMQEGGVPREAFMSWVAAVVRANRARAGFGSPQYVRDAAALSTGA